MKRRGLLVPMSRAAIGVASIVATPSWSAAQTSNTSRIAVSWSAPPGCPDEAAARASIERLLGRPLDKASPEALSFRVTLVARGSEWSAQVEQLEPGNAAKPPIGERTLEGESCRAVADAAAVSIALAIDARAQGQSPPPPEPPRPSPPPPRHERPTAKPPAPRAPEPRIALRIGAVGDAGTLPRVAPGVTGTVAVVGTSARLELSAAYFAEERGLAKEDANVGGDIGLVGASLRGCYVAVIVGLRPTACAGLEAGVMSAHAVGVSRAFDRTYRYAAATAGVALPVPLGAGFELWLELGALAPLFAPQFSVQNVGVVHRPAAVAGRGTLGIERFF